MTILCTEYNNFDRSLKVLLFSLLIFIFSLDFPLFASVLLLFLGAQGGGFPPHHPPWVRQWYYLYKFFQNIIFFLTNIYKKIGKMLFHSKILWYKIEISYRNTYNTLLLVVFSLNSL